MARDKDTKEFHDYFRTAGSIAAIISAILILSRTLDTKTMTFGESMILALTSWASYTVVSTFVCATMAYLAANAWRKAKSVLDERKELEEKSKFGMPNSVIPTVRSFIYQEMNNTLSCYLGFYNVGPLTHSVYDLKLTLSSGSSDQRYNLTSLELKPDSAWKIIELSGNSIPDARKMVKMSAICPSEYSDALLSGLSVVFRVFIEIYRKDSESLDPSHTHDVVVEPLCAIIQRKQ